MSFNPILQSDKVAVVAGKSKEPIPPDLTTYAKLAVSVTVDELLALKDSSSLILNQWYKVTDYRTISVIRGATVTSVDEIYYAPTEILYVKATAVNELAGDGFSGSYPTETIKFTTTTSPITKDMAFYADSAGYAESNSTTLLARTATTLAFANTDEPLSEGFGYLYAVDPVSYVELYIDFGDASYDYMYTFTGGVFTLLVPPDDFDFTNIFPDPEDPDPVWSESAYFESSWYVLLAQPKGMITARYNFKTDFYCDVDYRGIKIRRWAVSNAPAWSAGTTTAGSLVTYNGYIWGCTKTTTSNPQFNNCWTPFWSTSFPFNYPLPSESVTLGIFTFTGGAYFDYPNPISGGAYTGTQKSSSAVRGNWTDFNLLLGGVPSNSTISFTPTAATTCSTISSVNLKLGATCVTVSLSDSPSLSISSSFVNNLSYSSASISNSIVYQFTSSSGSLISNSMLAYTCASSTFGSINNTKFYGDVSNNDIMYTNSVTALQAFNYNRIQYCSANTFNNTVTKVYAAYLLNNTWGAALNTVNFYSNVQNNTFNNSINTSNFYALVASNNLSGSTSGLMTGCNFYEEVSSNTGAGTINWTGCSFYYSCYNNTITGGATMNYCHWYGSFNSNSWPYTYALFNVDGVGNFNANIFNSLNTASIQMNNVTFKGGASSNNFRGTLRNMEIGDSFNSNTLTGTTERGVIYASFQSKTLTGSSYVNLFGYPTSSLTAFGNDAPTSTVDVAGSFGASYRAVSATYTLGLTDYTIDCTANTFTVNLPTAVGITGRIYNIKNTGTGVITVDANGTQTIDGSLTITLNQWDNIKIQSTGANWIIIK